MALCNKAINKGDEVCVGVRRLQLIPLKRKATDEHFFREVRYLSMETQISNQRERYCSLHL